MENVLTKCEWIPQGASGFEHSNGSETKAEMMYIYFRKLMWRVLRWCGTKICTRRHGGFELGRTARRDDFGPRPMTKRIRMAALLMWFRSGGRIGPPFYGGSRNLHWGTDFDVECVCSAPTSAAEAFYRRLGEIDVPSINALRDRSYSQRAKDHGSPSLRAPLANWCMEDASLRFHSSETTPAVLQNLYHDPHTYCYKIPGVGDARSRQDR
ncbi:hypothetical protein PHMEG_00019315 [Phytophthora megakarya]|uniref:Uncharacterized protein n=1 Tax=Phytophthora megakarya TaxID=4795 RepID=A0A225VUE9_9STRA|nr:hypothetical protein PHMEG_00019315 [Phytophthora megakarya]